MYQGPTSQTLSDVYFADSLSGWMCGAEGIFRTTDAGATWVHQYAGGYTWPNYPRLAGVNKQLCWAIGQRDTLLHTADGGQSWTKLSLAPALDSIAVLSRVCFVDSLYGWVLGERRLYENFVLKTTNGGGIWQAVPIPFGGGEATLCSFTDLLHGWVSGEKSVYRTTDGGESWHFASSVYNRAVDLQFLTDSLGWISEDGPSMSTAVRKTNDGGTNWTIQLWFQLSDLTTRLFFTDNLRGWVVPFSWVDPVGAQIWHTSDGGSTWERQFVYNPSFYYRPWRVFFSDPYHGWIVGEQGIVLRTNDGGVTSAPDQNTELPERATLWQNYPNPFNSSTAIMYAIPTAGFVELTFVNSLGQTVGEVPTRFHKQGSYGFHWATTDDLGRTLPSGMYVCVLTHVTSNGSIMRTSRKMILLK